ncbi:hypothetical protein [Sphingomonas sp.]|uniref:hypothetical protein n=1 Tax=Sphingomonas sp. TaxID=28214 RepID=UPI003BAB3217
MAKVQRTVQYRYLHRARAGLAPGTETLSQLLARGLRMRHGEHVIGERAKLRIADLDQAGQLTVLNGIKGLDADSFLAGELLLYRKGFDVPAISEDLDGEHNRFELNLFKTDGKNKPIVGALYFAAIGDHCGIIASQSVTPRWLERYLTWLMKDKSELLDVEDVIELSNFLPVADAPEAAKAEARGFRIRAGAVNSAGQSERVKKKDAKGEGGTVLEVLRVLGVGDDAIESIRQDIPDDGKLEGDFQVYIRRGRKREAVSSRTLNHALRNVDQDDLDIDRKGSKARGGKLYLAEPVRVTETPAGLDPNEAIEQIIGQLYRWGNAGTINLGQDP